MSFLDLANRYSQLKDKSMETSTEVPRFFGAALPILTDDQDTAASISTPATPGSFQNPINTDTANAPKAFTLSAKYAVCNMAVPVDILLAEDIMTKSLRCQDSLSKLGDVMVVREDHTFNKEGTYFVAIKYIEVTGEQ